MAKNKSKIDIVDIKNVRLKIDLSITFLRTKSIIIQTGIIKLNIKTGKENVWEIFANQEDCTWFISINNNVIINKKIKKVSPNRKNSNTSFDIIFLC